MINHLRDACMKNGFYVSWDDCVREDAAAWLLCISAKTLRNRRYDLNPHTPAFVRRNGRPYYALGDIAEMLANMEASI